VLLCYLWCNVETSCHKEFVIFSCNQHRCLLRAMCHNLRDSGCGPLATVFTTPSLLQPDIGWESRFLPTPPEFDAPVRGFPLEYCYAVWHGKTRMVWLPDGEKILMTCLFVLTQLTNVTDKHTDRQTHTDTAWRHRPRLCIASRGKKLISLTGICNIKSYL